MKEKYFVNTYTTQELQDNLNALVKQGYEITNIFPAGEYMGNTMLVVVAKYVAPDAETGGADE
jgi:hypothetical protein